MKFHSKPSLWKLKNNVVGCFFLPAEWTKYHNKNDSRILCFFNTLQKLLMKIRNIKSHNNNILNFLPIHSSEALEKGTTISDYHSIINGKQMSVLELLTKKAFELFIISHLSEKICLWKVINYIEWQSKQGLPIRESAVKNRHWKEQFLRANKTFCQFRTKIHYRIFFK